MVYVVMTYDKRIAGIFPNKISAKVFSEIVAGSEVKEVSWNEAIKEFAKVYKF